MRPGEGGGGEGSLSGPRNPEFNRLFLLSALTVDPSPSSLLAPVNVAALQKGRGKYKFIARRKGRKGGRNHSLKFCKGVHVGNSKFSTWGYLEFWHQI